MADNFLWREFRQTFSSGSMLMRLIVVNVIVFLMLHLLDVIIFLSQGASGYIEYTFIPAYLGIPANLTSLLHRPWTIITYSFTHFNFLHILFNMLWLYWIGSIFAEFLGNKRVLPVYLMGSWFGAVFFIAAYNLFPAFRLSAADSIAIGASAGVLAIIVATATKLPDYSVMVFIWPVRLKWIAVVTVVLDFIDISRDNAGGHIAHLGGALFGFIFIKQLDKGRDLSSWMNNFFDWLVGIFSGRPKLKVSYSKPSYSGGKSLKKQAEKNQEKLDAILDKISKSGYESLSKEEKEFLFKASHDGK